MNGILVSSHFNVKSKQLISIDSPSGAYQVSVKVGNEFFQKLMIIE